MNKSRFKNLDHLKVLQEEMPEELLNKILPYWIEKVSDVENGGFIGRITGLEKRMPKAEKSVILNTRLLWTFSAAYRILGDDKYRQYAERAFNYMEEKFQDKDYGGFYWSVDHKGRVADDKKHVYAQAFAIFSYSEYARATESKIALKRAMETFQLLEENARDRDHEGYNEAFSGNWKLMDDARLSENEAYEQRSMNTHLHIMESYSNLYRAVQNSLVRDRLIAVTELVLTRMYDQKSGHFNAFFDHMWNAKSDVYSYGHDIEAAWLIMDAAEVVNSPELKIKVEQTARKIAYTTLREGIDSETGGVFTTGNFSRPLDRDFHWWVQAEAITGFLYLYELTGDSEFLEKSHLIWNFIKENIRDPDHGEWFFRVNSQGDVYKNEDKVGPWKCPYHNSRVCLIIIERFNKGFVKVPSNTVHNTEE